jgi:hypothetical protein
VTGWASVSVSTLRSRSNSLTPLGNWTPVVQPVLRRCTHWATLSCSPLKVMWLFGRTFRSLTCCLLHVGFLVGLLFNRENGSEILLWNVGWLSTAYVTLYASHRRENLNSSLNVSRWVPVNYLAYFIVSDPGWLRQWGSWLRTDNHTTSWPALDSPRFISCMHCEIILLGWSGWSNKLTSWFRVAMRFSVRGASPSSPSDSSWINTQARGKFCLQFILLSQSKLCAGHSSRAWTLFALSDAVIVGSNLT